MHTVQPVYVGHRSIQTLSVPNLPTPHGIVQISLCNYHVFKCTVQSAQTGGPVGQQVQQVHNPVINTDLNGSVAAREFQSIVHTCGKGWRLAG
jgi:hypothetical protein